MSQNGALRALPDKEWLTADEVAAYQGCSVESIHARRRRGLIKARLHGTRTWRFSRQMVLELDRQAKAIPAIKTPGNDITALIDARVAEHFERFAAQLRGEA